MIDGEDKQEIIIVRRVSGGEEGHHGGAWKIAFADFMTAMMALFLVLWLVNAANEKTKKAVASYFNPVKLTDRERSDRGLDDNTGTGVATVHQMRSNSDEEIPGEKDDGSSKPVRDREFFEDPFAVMEGLADKEQEKIEQSETSLAQAYMESAPSDDAFHDPFAQAVPTPPIDDSSKNLDGGDAAKKAESVLPELGEPLAKPKAEFKPKEDQTVKEETPKQESVEKSVVEATPLKPEMKPAVEIKPAEEIKPDRKEKLEKLAKEVLSEIKEKLAEKFGDNGQISDSLSVEATPEGILISITDQLDYSMFQVGSAVPKGAIILAMEEISSVLKIRSGKVRVYGHTDARPYSGNGYDNWRLSTARGHAARLMLIRGKLKEQRISQVVGFADRRLRIPAAPQADANRRIEILLEVS